MAALKEGARLLFQDGVRSALEAWPALQVAVENGFGGAYSQQKADWMVSAVAQYFSDNVDLESEEVEELMADMIYNEFDTVVEDGSLSEVALQIWTFFGLCQRGQEAEVRGRIRELVQRKGSVKVNAVQGESPGDEDSEDEEEEEEEKDDETEAMDCDAHVLDGAPSPRQQPDPSSTASQEVTAAEKEDLQDGWKVVRRRKK
ncbi:pre-rRNA-processing protein TSR2 homolog [Carcharodon carcharias]|uniref:pre-rRNA-processing protein TSR2 homolog n=1 Tax=Carcharodon carcharias TaxID=13397 RepID=UPI001B7DF361|nr:pre-rRNA-processing protein TSR2 homolog [Carcharodon carcharias]